MVGLFYSAKFHADRSGFTLLVGEQDLKVVTKSFAQLLIIRPLVTRLFDGSL